MDDAERADLVIDTFEDAVRRHGKPEMVLHDKGSAFWAWNGISRFTALLTELGIDQIPAEHKEWNGKLEVFNANLAKELFNVHRFYDVAEMRRRLAAHLHFYNHDRTSHALGGLLVPVVSPLLAAGRVLAALPHLASVHLRAPVAAPRVRAPAGTAPEARHAATAGRSRQAEILEANGSRVPARRGRSPDESGLRGQFETFFAGGQWIGEEGVATTGARPLALLLDNKPSNHAPEVDQALGDTTTRIRATLFRPQNKAHVEGAFGLFAQTVPEIVLTTDDPFTLVHQVVRLVATTWARATNHRPRADRGGRSRFGLYGADPPTDADVARARVALDERRRRQERARETRAARQDPVVRAAISDAFGRFRLADPEGHLLTAIARYSLDHVLAGIATYAAKVAAKTLPDGADARYLLGIVRTGPFSGWTRKLSVAPRTGIRSRW